MEASQMEASSSAATPKKYGLGMRHLQVALNFVGMMIAYALRVNLSIAIVAMVDKEGANPDYPEYDWDEATQSMILSAFSWGYIFLQVPGGLLSERWGPKIMLALSQLGTSLFSILTPLAATQGDWKLVFACRFVQGLFQGILYPATHAYMARWIPLDERGTLITVAYAGGQLGTVLAMPLSGVMSTGSGGWPSVFYLFGSIGIAWTALWMWLGADSPALDRHISAEERDYIQESLQTKQNTGKRLATPWKAILTSWPMWAIIVAHGGWGLGFWLMLTELPTFLKTVFGYDLQENGFLSALPWLVMFVLNIAFSVTSDFINNRKTISLTTSRKLFNTIGAWIPCIALIGVGYSLDATLSMILFVVAVAVNSACNVGFHINHIDMAPNFAGTMMGLSNSAGNLLGSFGPLLVGVVVQEAGSLSQWRIVFLLAAALYFFSGLFYLWYASAELQQWNAPPRLQDREAAETDCLLQHGDQQEGRSDLIAPIIRRLHADMARVSGSIDKLHLGGDD